jgi:hypothetical protein
MTRLRDAQIAEKKNSSGASMWVLSKEISSGISRQSEVCPHQRRQVQVEYRGRGRANLFPVGAGTSVFSYTHTSELLVPWPSDLG